MIQINRLEDYLQLFEQAGWKKTRTGDGYVCRLDPSVGRGSVQIYGDTRAFYYIKIDFSYWNDFVSIFSIEEPYIEISNNVENAFTENSTSPDDLIAGRGLNCHINLEKLKVTQRFPAGMRFWKESLVIREAFLQEKMPAFFEHEIFSMAAAIRSGGINDPRIAVLFKQLNAFPLRSAYGQTYLKGKIYEVLALLQNKANEVKLDKVVLSAEERVRLKQAIAFMKEHYSQSIRVTDLTKQFALNRNKLQVGVHVLTGYTVHECLLNIRVQEATELLVRSEQSIADIAKRVGFRTVKSLYDAFSKFLSITPNYFRKTLRK